MRILAINNNNHINFRQSTLNTINIGKITGVKPQIDEFVKTEFDEKKENKLQHLTNSVYEKFTQHYDKAINNIEKFKHPYNKAYILNELAHSYYKNGNIEKSAIILAQAFNDLDKNAPYRQDDIKKLVESDVNKNILQDFFYCSNNTKANFFVMQSLNKLDNKFYLPIAEAICDCDEDRVTVNDRKTINEARMFLNRYYNLALLNSYTNDNDNYKVAILEILSKWGIENHYKIAEKLTNDENEYIQSKAIKTVSKLKNISKQISGYDDFFEENRVLPQNKPVFDKFAILKRLDEKENVSIDDIKKLGQRGFSIREAKALISNNHEYSKINAAKAEAFLKIMIRGNLKKSYLE